MEQAGKSLHTVPACHGREAHGRWSNPEGTRLYVAHEQDELPNTPNAGQKVCSVFDVADPFSPRHIAQIPLGELEFPSGKLRNKKSINLVYARPGTTGQARDRGPGVSRLFRVGLVENRKKCKFHVKIGSLAACAGSHVEGRNKMLIDSVLTTWSPRVLSIFRIIIGLLFLEHGTSKYLSLPVSPMTGVNPLSLSGINGVIELVGGVLIVLGLFTRPVAFILSGDMAVAYFIAHAPRGFFPLLNGGELAIVYCFAFLYLAAAGGGEWSIDHLRAGSEASRARSA